MHDSMSDEAGEGSGSQESGERTRVEADDRERGSGVIRALLERGDVSVTVRRLVLGDYLVDGRLLVERKTIRDFAVSILDGRLFSQVHLMVRSAGRQTCLILEGRGRDLLATGMSREALQGALITVTLVHGMPVLRSTGPEETANLLLTAGRQLEARALGLPRRYGHKVRSTERVRLQLLQAVPGVGKVRARALLASFGTPAGVCAATTEEIARVSGVGRTTARNLCEVLRGA